MSAEFKLGPEAVPSSANGEEPALSTVGYAVTRLSGKRPAKHFRYLGQRLLTLSVDLVAVAAALALAGGPPWPVSVAFAVMILLGVGATVTNPFLAFGGHLGRRWVTLGAVVAFVALAVSILLPEAAATIAPLAGATLLGLGLGRSLLRFVALRMRERGTWLERTVILGAGDVGQELADALLRHPAFGLHPVGFVDDITDDPGPLPLLGSVQDLQELLTEHDIGVVLLAFGPVKDPELVHRVRLSVTEVPTRVLALPRFFELGVAKHAELDLLFGYPLVELSPPPHHRATWRLKRLVDVLMAGTLLTVLAPLMTLIALAVKRSGPGSIIFRQVRLSRQGEPIEVLKFRTMAPNTDGDVAWSVEHDDRVTRIGRVLRPTHLDELPQLVNVLRGEMSLVGPRPERPHFVHQFSEEIRDYQHRHRVPAGLTGLAQVNGLWGDTSIRQRARLDNRYIEDWSLLSDLRILGRTASTLTGRRKSAVGSNRAHGDDGTMPAPAPHAAAPRPTPEPCPETS
jgi:exopolysaccharide biosynthesis polyprenyl glycosylphosphotransferase